MESEFRHRRLLPRLAGNTIIRYWWWWWEVVINFKIGQWWWLNLKSSSPESYPNSFLDFFFLFSNLRHGISFLSPLWHGHVSRLVYITWKSNLWSRFFCNELLQTRPSLHANWCFWDVDLWSQQLRSKRTEWLPFRSSRLSSAHHRF